MLATLAWSPCTILEPRTFCAMLSKAKNLAMWQLGACVQLLICGVLQLTGFAAHPENSVGLG